MIDKIILAILLAMLADGVRYEWLRMILYILAILSFISIIFTAHGR
jgi:hypothetical protein